MNRLLLLLAHFSLVISQATQNSSNPYLGFLQISNDHSGKDDDGLEEDSKVLTVFLLNVLFCILCCGLIQVVIMFSKKMNAELIALRKNYKQHKDLMRYKTLREAYSQEKESLDEQFK